jgi:hypothetical protein
MNQILALNFYVDKSREFSVSGLEIRYFTNNFSYERIAY